jgi:protein-tyrosine phosphatase
MKNILVICIGNICRSPMAEAMLKQALPGARVYSAGLGALIGKPADPLAVQVMAERGIDVREHRAQQISLGLVSQADLVLVMDLEQKKHIETRYPAARGKIFRLGEGEKVDIPDPYREGLDSFQNVQQLISRGVKFWAAHIAQMS